MSDKIIANFQYFQCPNDIFDLDLTTNEKIIYMYLCRCSNNSEAFPSYSTIGKKTSTSRITAIRTIEKLIEKKILFKECRKEEKKNKSNIYQVNLNLTNFLQSSGISEIPPSITEIPPSSITEIPPSITEIPYKELYKNNYSDKELNKFKQKKQQKLNYNSESVLLSKEEYEKLIKNYGVEDTKKMIEILDNYKLSSGKKYKSDYRAILNWVVGRLKEDKYKENKYNNNYKLKKPIQETNYEQRQYSDEFFNNLYDNVEYVKE